ncbi:MAG: SAF domain-containing protein [Actinobacteria bacterium]|nr:SAF domain-containing protein [Actinomycetota bacterium]
MLWLQPIPWARWLAATAIAAIALWVELAPDPATEHAFASVDIARGEALTAANIELREVPAGLLAPPGPGSVAGRDIPAGAPLGPGDTAHPETLVPEDWWVLATELPPGARQGDRVLIVLLDAGETVAGVVASTEADDPFAVGLGAIAVPPELAPEVAHATAAGRTVVLVGAG